MSPGLNSREGPMLVTVGIEGRFQQSDSETVLYLHPGLSTKGDIKDAQWMSTSYYDLNHRGSDPDNKCT